MTTKAETNGVAKRRIDLDSARVARQEVAGEPVVLTFKGVDFELPAEMPIEFGLLAQEGEIRKALELLLGDRMPEFFALKPSVKDFEAFSDGASREYGLQVGEAPASGDS